jgi:hypothetical protein
VKANLSKIGYEHADISSCGRWFVNKEIIKRLFDGNFLTKSSVVSGHWALLKERAYTDSMAVACAEAWQAPDIAQKTDPLEPSQLVQRFAGSVNFLKRVWVAEKEVFKYTSHNSAKRLAYNEFSTTVDDLNFPSVTQYVAREYLNRIGKMPDYQAPAAAIRADQAKWDACLRDLGKLVRDSNVIAMSARRQ